MCFYSASIYLSSLMIFLSNNLGYTLDTLYLSYTSSLFNFLLAGLLLRSVTCCDVLGLVELELECVAAKLPLGISRNVDAVCSLPSDFELYILFFSI
jgi:hypothetical protein